MRNPDIAKVPGFMGNARDLLLVLGIALHKAEERAALAEGLTDSLIGKFGPDEIDAGLRQSQVNGKPGLMFAVAGHGDIFAGKGGAIVRHGIVP